MLKTDHVVKYIESKKDPVSFEEIWKNVKKETISSLGKTFPEEVIKSDLYHSLMEEEKIMMIGNNVWELKSRHSLKDVLGFEKSLTEEYELNVVEESDDTRELKLNTIRKD